MRRSVQLMRPNVARLASVLVVLACTRQIPPPVESTGVVATGRLEVLGAPPPELETLPCNLEPTLRSTSGEWAAVITFSNQRTEPIELIWLDYAGKRRSYGPLAAGASRVQGTYATHPWIIATRSGACLEIRVPRVPRFRVTIH
jgi:hypothetical protein